MYRWLSDRKLLIFFSFRLLKTNPKEKQEIINLLRAIITQREDVL